MAGERIGKTDEAILKVVLDRLVRKGAIEGSVFWNEKPVNVVVEPDLTLGSDKDHPFAVFLITHSTTPNNSQMKCWRNLGELSDLKVSISPSPLVINIVFDSVIKEDLKNLQDAAFDSQIIVGDEEFGRIITAWVIENDPQLPTDQYEKALFIDHLHDELLEGCLSVLSSRVVLALNNHRPELDQLWQREEQRQIQPAPVARNTYLRLGFMKRLLIGDALQGNTIKIDDTEWVTGLGLIGPSIAGPRVIDSDLIWFLQTKYAENYQIIASYCMSVGFSQQLRKIRSYALMKAYGAYVADHIDSLATSEGMERCIRQQYENPAKELELPEQVEKPDTVWIYDFLTSFALVQGQRFGYPDFSRHSLSKEQYIGSIAIGDWCSRFLTSYFTRKQNVNTPDSAIKYASVVMSEQLRGITASVVHELNDKIVSEFLQKEYQTSMPSHRGFEPLLAILISEGIVENANAKVNIKACFAEKAGLGGQAGKTPVVVVKNTLIKWQTATDAGRDHKRNELCGRAVGLRYSWNPETNEFEKRPGIEKMILLLDGTWRQKDLDALIKAGWDEIYYPDEIDKLKTAIV